MNIGITAEYNPFHNGHKYQIDKIREENTDCSIIAVMSGSFVQRGEPAAFSKFERARCALLNGVDMVIELPYIYSCSAADIFGFAAIDLMNKTGIIDKVCFGTEEKSLEDLLLAAEIFANEPPEFKQKLKLELSGGASYPAARQSALEKTANRQMNFISMPNNILAVEYLKALKQSKSQIAPYAVQRVFSSFNSTEITGHIASANAIRKALHSGSISSAAACMPENCQYLDFNAISSINRYSSIFHYLLAVKSSSELTEISDITEGIENRILAYSQANQSITELINAIKTKRYTYTKLQRAVLHIILDLKKDDLRNYMSAGTNLYIRVLGFKKGSAGILSAMSKNASVPIIINPARDKHKLSGKALAMFNAEAAASKIYNISTKAAAVNDYSNPLVLLP